MKNYWKHGAGSDGRVWVAVNGQVIADHHGRNMINSPLYTWSLFKVYTGPEVLDVPPAAFSDCNTADPAACSTPGEVADLNFDPDRTTWRWQPPGQPGSLPGAFVYDILRSSRSDDFSMPTCVESSDGSNTSATDTDTPAPGTAWFYLVRAGNSCPDGAPQIRRTPARQEGGSERHVEAGA